jgi:hypothetical protein
MARRLSHPDPALVLAMLDERDRETVARWTESLGLDGWDECPPLATLLPILAALRLAAMTPDIGRQAAFREAAASLGAEDYAARDTFAGDSLLRTLHRWLAATRPRQNVEAPGRRAA